LQGLGTLAAVGRNPRQMLAVLCLASFLLEILIPRLIMGTITEQESPRKIALLARSLAGPDTRIVTVGPMQAVSWYTGKRVIVAGNPDEMEFGSKQGDQSAWFVDYIEFVRIWEGNTHLLTIIKKEYFDVLTKFLTTSPHILGTSGRLLLISNR
jgi:hypothetical protein